MSLPRRPNSSGLNPIDWISRSIHSSVVNSRRARQVAVEVEVGELDRLDRAEDPGADARVVAVEVLDVADAPHAADEQLRVGLDGAGVDEHLLDAEVGELGLVDVVLVVEVDADLVDDLVAARAR